MANICGTTIKFIGPRKDLDKLVEIITNGKEIITHSIQLEDIAYRAGIRPEVINLRGSVLDYSIDDNDLTVYVDSKWVPLLAIWQAVISTLKIDIKFTALSVEPGCEIVQIYDPDNLDIFEYDYFIDKELDSKFGIYDPEGEEYLTEQELIDAAKQFFSKEENDINKILDMVNAYNDSLEDGYLNCYRFEHVNEIYD